MERSVGRRLKYVFDHEHILATIKKTEGDHRDSWRKANGFWGRVIENLGLKNKILLRKALYTRWVEDRGGLKSGYLQNMALHVDEWLDDETNEKGEPKEMQNIELNNQHVQLVSKAHTYITGTSYLKHSFDDACYDNDTESEEFPLCGTYALQKEDSSVGSLSIDSGTNVNNNTARTGKNVEEILTSVQDCTYNEDVEADSRVSARKTMNDRISLEVDNTNVNVLDVGGRLCKRQRYKPKVFTPDKKDVWCLCQKEDIGFYLICDFKMDGCLEFYHPGCVGLSHITSRTEGERYTNCSDGKSYICPNCARKVTRHDWLSCDQADDGYHFSEKSGNKKESDVLGAKDSFADDEQMDTVNSKGFSDELSDEQMANYDFIIDHFVEYPSPISRSVNNFNCFDEEIESYNTPLEDEFETNDSRIGTPESLFYEDYESDEESSEDEAFTHGTCNANVNEDNPKEDKLSPIPHETLQRMMDCPALPRNDTYFLADLPSTARFRLTDEEWNRMKPTRERPNTLRCPWTDIMANHMKQSNDFCAFHFERHYIIKENSRKRNTPVIFHASGHCVFEDCSCTFKLQMRRKDFVSKIIAVQYEGSVRHSAGERQSRFIKSDTRKELANAFHKGPDKPSKVYQEIKYGLSANAKASGNRTGCGNQPSTIRKIASEGQRLSELDDDVLKSLEKVMNELTEKEKRRVMPPKAITGFVHAISFTPFWVYMWTEDQVRLWHDVSSKDIVYMDATGTIVRDFSGKRILYYALVVRHPKRGNPSVPVAEMITNDHSAPCIRAFLERFRRDESAIFRGRMQAPRQLNTDYSKAIILAALKEFNGETIENYFKRVFKVLRKEADASDFNFMVLHVGCSHFMSIVHRKLKAIIQSSKHATSNESCMTQSDIWYRFNMYCASLLVNSRTQDEFDSILKDVAICMLSKRQNNDVLKSFNRLWLVIHNMDDKDVIFNVDEKNDIEEGDGDTLEDMDVMESNPNPFKTYYDSLLAIIKSRVAKWESDNIDDLDEMPQNRSFCPIYFAFIESYLREMPLWSGVLLGSLDRYICHESIKYNNIKDCPYLSFTSANAHTEGYVEGVMRNLKQEDFPGRRRLRPDAFVLENYERIRRRMTDFSDRVVCKGNKKKLIKYNDVTNKKTDTGETSSNAKKNCVKRKDTQAQRQVNTAKKCMTNKREVDHEIDDLFAELEKIWSTSDLDDLVEGSKATSKISENDDEASSNVNSTENVKNTPGKGDVTYIDVDEYSSVRETWGKKEPSTPKRKPNIGQFQQSPSVPLSNTPEMKRKTKKGNSSALLEFMHDDKNKIRQDGRRKQSDLMTAASKKGQNLTISDKERLTNIELVPKDDRNGSDESVGKGAKIQRKCMRNGNKDQKAICKKVSRGMINKANNCWLNCLIQCVNAMNIRIPESDNAVTNSLEKALISTLREMRADSGRPFYPLDLHKVFITDCGFLPGRQQDIHESYTALFPGHSDSCFVKKFTGECHYIKTCTLCDVQAILQPETFNTLFVTLDRNVNDLVECIEDSMVDCVDLYCDSCLKNTSHDRIGFLDDTPEIMCILFKRFTNDAKRSIKNKKSIFLPSTFLISCKNGQKKYRLSSCALHYGVGIENGHYTAVVFKNNAVYEINDTAIEDISLSWQNSVAAHVYMAFYIECSDQFTDDCKKEEIVECVDIRSDSNSLSLQTIYIPDDLEEFSDSSTVGVKRSKSGFLKKSLKKTHSQKPQYECVDVNDSDSVASETTGDDQRTIQLPEDIASMRDSFFQMCGASIASRRLCNTETHGFVLFGRDIKTLEPREINKSNESYTLENPGWLNDAIIDAYLSLIVRECLSRGVQCHAFTTQFITKLRAVSAPGKENELRKMIARHHRSITFDIHDAMVIPVNTGNGRHWCIIIVDCRTQLICFYDPLQRGVHMTTLLKCIIKYFEELYAFRSYMVEINHRRFVTDFSVHWEDRFPIQEDFIGCGIYILSYARYRLGLFNGLPYSEVINCSRPIIAYELVRGHLINTPDKNTVGARKCIVVPTLYEQSIDGMVKLRCLVIGEMPLKFEWILQNNKVAFDQTYSFMLQEDNIGTYHCLATYKGGIIVKSNDCVLRCKRNE